MLSVSIAASYSFGLQNVAGFLVPLRAREPAAPLEVIGLIVAAGELLPALLPGAALRLGAGKRLTDRRSGRPASV